MNGYEIGSVARRGRESGDVDRAATAIRDALDNLENFESGHGHDHLSRALDRIPVRPVALLRYEGGKAECLQSVTPAASEIPAPL